VNEPNCNATMTTTCWPAISYGHLTQMGNDG
jgi:hypothetical protein